ncbi:hypothetical protein SOM12_23310 [Flavobacterium sp. CFBP9031]|uniref:hypothetical protein n=1 Tax=Flavobacterium sp. CFBP9031 TaxID=3096538 RepID=UPI002A6AAFDB|nr:hypothetical protein [Flavobacterium sp. CFBP9031]MDY0990376.1 hypothetical protein [Flavobacterium sp. CFBP9031]
MKNKVLSSLFILFCCCVYPQTNTKIGFTTKTPTETVDINGIARVRELPTNAATNAINTKPDGTASTAKDQTFSATKTVVVDANGVMGTIDGIAITVAPEIKTIQYARVATPINASTPTNSITTIGILSIRFNSTTTGSGNSIEFLTSVPNQVTAFAEVSGAGGNYFANWRTTAAAANTWYQATAQGVTAANRDTYTLMITLHNSLEIYRVSLICNASIAANTSLNIPIVPAQVIIFIEKLQ